MILVDTSVWIDHLHKPEPVLIKLLTLDDIACHPLVIEELALGAIEDRRMVLGLLGHLRGLAVATHAEVRELVDVRRLWGRGLGAVDVHLLASVLISPGSTLWSRDKRLTAAAREVQAPIVSWR